MKDRTNVQAIVAESQRSKRSGSDIVEKKVENLSAEKKEGKMHRRQSGVTLLTVDI